MRHRRNMQAGFLRKSLRQKLRGRAQQKCRVAVHLRENCRQPDGTGASLRQEPAMDIFTGKPPKRVLAIGEHMPELLDMRVQ